jgi:predicted alpha/beta hydrolase family esterase
LTTTVLILPGLGNSGRDHWQTRWEKKNAAFRRVEQSDWDLPICLDWVKGIDAAVAQAGEDTVLVAHSLACLAVAQWAALTPRPIRGALLVAVPDPAGLDFPVEAVGFGPIPRGKLPFPSIVVASSDDVFSSIAFAKRCASRWGGEFVNVGAAGHINGESKLGDWAEGLALLQKLIG